MYFAESVPTVLAVTDLVAGSRSLYTIGVGVLVVFILLAAGGRAVGAFFSGRIGSTVAWALTGVIVAVMVGGGYAIYASAKRTVDRTGITTGQFSQ
ncbi:MAG: glycosyl transferase family 39 [Mycobacteriaceae bacterium]|nr:glycosyl transferase family 39 [Mycobacteriaceae bacterium]